MPAFKPKATKKIKHDEKTSITLDNKHNELLNDFENNKTVKIPELKEKKKILKERLKSENITVEDIRAEERRLGLDKPFLVRAFNWMGNVFFKGEFGDWKSTFRQPISVKK